jgi:zinc transport system ATP-binding protein
LFGEPPHEARKFGRIGYVPQRATQFENRFPATVLEVVQSGLSAVPSSKREPNAVQNAMEVTNITNIQSKPMYELSGGQQQRVFIARCLTAKPKMLLLDEPITGVDTPSKDRFYALLRELNTAHGITILFVTHDVDTIAKEVGKVLCLNQKVCCHASPQDFLKKHVLDELYASPQHSHA